MLCARPDFCTGTYPCHLVSPSNGGGFCLAGCDVASQTQGFYLVGIWGSWIKFQGVGGGGLKGPALC